MLLSVTGQEQFDEDQDSANQTSEVFSDDEQGLLDY